MQQRNIFAGPYLDRSGHLRQDPEWFAAALADERSRAIPVWNSRNLIAEGDAPRAVFLELSRIPLEQRNSTDLILLGRLGDTNFFTYEVESLRAALPGAGQAASKICAWPPRSCRSTKPGCSVTRGPWCPGGGGIGSAVSAARKTIPAKSGHVLVCSDPACRHEQFPRIDPAIIVLVHSDGERALLGRQASWPVGRYSTIAGFVEPGGESLEDVPWPARCSRRPGLPSTGSNITPRSHGLSLRRSMLGFTAHALTTEVHLQDQELEDARWFTRADLTANGALLPPRQSISFRLIEHWFDAGGGARLRDLQGTAPWPQSR